MWFSSAGQSFDGSAAPQPVSTTIAGFNAKITVVVAPGLQHPATDAMVPFFKPACSGLKPSSSELADRVAAVAHPGIRTCSGTAAVDVEGTVTLIVTLSPNG